MMKPAKNNLLEIESSDESQQKHQAFHDNGFAIRRRKNLLQLMLNQRFSPIDRFGELFDLNRWRTDILSNATNLIFIACFLSTFFAAGFLTWEFYRTKNIVTQPDQIAAQQVSRGKNPTPQPTGNYRALQNRQFFESGRNSGRSSSTPVNAATVLGLAQRYTLLGVISGNTPQAIIRENSSNSSLFLTAGSRVGEYVIDKILPDKVLLSRDGDLVELTL